MPLSASRRSRAIASLALLVVVVLVAAMFVVGRQWLAQRQAADARSPSLGLAMVAVSERTEPVQLSGETLDGKVLDIADWQGQVVVVNVWGSWCAPCRDEAPDLARVHRETRSLPVQFVGVDVRDDRAAAQSFTRKYGIGYPSLFDRDGSLLLAFSGSIPVRAVPSTVVLDTRGRIAATNAGIIDAETLRSIIDDVLAESSVRADTRGGASI